MKAALLYGVKDLRLVEVATPAIGPNEVLVRVRACGVCPTDLRKYRTGDNGTLKLPMNLGHEWVGEVVQIGAKVTGFEPGMRTIGDTYAGYADYAILSAEARNLVFPTGPLHICATISDQELTFVEPLADCLHAVIDQAQVKPGQVVVVCGAGQMGLQMTAVAWQQGARVVVSEPVALRREFAREFGAEAVIDPTSQDVVEQVLNFTNGHGADAVIVAIGLPPLVNQALEMTRPLGRVVLFAGFERPAKAEIDPNLIHYKEIALLGSEWIGTPPHHRPELYQQAIDLIAEGAVPVKRLITGQFRLDQIEEAFAAAADRRSLKVVIYLDDFTLPVFSHAA